MSIESGHSAADVVLPKLPGHEGLAPGRLRHRLRIVVLLADLLAIGSAFALAWATKRDSHALLAVIAVIIPIYLGVMVNARGYFVTTLRDAAESMSVALQGLFFSFGALFLLLYFIRTEQDISRLFLASAMVASAILVATVRQVVASLIRRRWQDRLTAELAIVDGVDLDLPQHLPRIAASDYAISPDLADPAQLNRFAMLVREQDRVIIACRPEQRKAWAMMLKGANVLGEVIVDDIGATGAFGISSVEHHTTLLVASGPLTLSQRLIKRGFDLALAIPALLALAPLLLLTALAIKLDSRGPVFFRQRRVGRGNAFFDIFKFRSMRVEASDSAGNRSASRDDDRITRVGRFIRSTSIDELPQLLNILSGSMSLVGPRPHALGSLAGDQLFWEIDHRYWHRHACKPGLTGLAQVRGFRGATHKREDLVNRLQADLEYLNGWNIWRDVSILLATIRVVVHRNAF